MNFDTILGMSKMSKMESTVRNMSQNWKNRFLDVLDLIYLEKFKICFRENLKLNEENLGKHEKIKINCRVLRFSARFEAPVLKRI